MEKIKNIYKQWIPSAIYNVVRKWQPFGTPEWEYVKEEWGYPARGWDKISVALAYENQYKTDSEKIRLPKIFGCGTELAYHNTIMVFGSVLGRVAWQKESISMLDWGGGLGKYLRIANIFFPHLKINYTCKETTEICGVAQRLQLVGRFSDNDNEVFNSKYDFVLASSSLHYEKDWQQLLFHTSNSLNENGYLLVTLQPFIKYNKSFVFIQRPYQYNYQTEYLGWCLNEEEFLKETSKLGLDCLQEFIIGYSPFIKNAPEQNQYKGFLFQKNKRS
jgi:putative methyltransferase (TIGR04325 family)